MIFQFVPKGQAKLYILERNSNAIVIYYSKHEMKKLYPKGEYHVIGEIGNFANKYPKQDEILTLTSKNIPIFPRGSMKKPFEWIIGYAAVGENTYVAVVKSLLPFLLFWR